MDLFTYLMAKNGNNSSVHGDLFSYLLGKGQSQTYTVSGTTIYIPNAKKLVNFMLTKESSQHTTSGKNKIDFTKTLATTNNVSYECNNTYQMYINGTANANATIQCNNSVYLDSGSYVFQLSFESGSIDSSGINAGFILRNEDTDSNITTINVNNNDNKYIEFTLTEPTNVKARMYVRTNMIFNNAVINLNVIPGNTPDYIFEEYTGGQPSPSPEFPQSVKTVKGYSNLFDKDNANILYGYINTNGNFYNYNITNRKYIYISCLSNTTYTISKITGKYFRVASFNELPTTNNTASINSDTSHDTNDVITFNTGENANYLIVNYIHTNNDTLTEQEILNSIMIIEGDQELPYVPYGNNYIAVNISDGTNTNQVPIPLNNNEIAGIGNYLDEYIIDKNGHCWLNKVMKKYIFTGNEDGWNLAETNINTYRFTNDKILKDNQPSTYLNNLMCNFFQVYNGNFGISDIDSEGIALRNNLNGFTIRALISRVTDLNGFKNYLQTQYNNGTPIIAYYGLATPELIDLQTTVDLKLFKGANTITNSEDANMTIEYR